MAKPKPDLRRAARSAPSAPAAIADAAGSLTRDAVLARIVALGPDGDPWIALGDQGTEPRPARTVVALGPSVVGRDALICFAGAGRTPVVVGVLMVAGDQTTEPSAPLIDLVIDRQRIVLSAGKEVVLRCGKASISLTADGRVVIKGADVVSSAGRTNRIRGGTVRIN